MRRGTTPDHTIYTDLDLAGAEVVYVTYYQNGEEVLEKTKNDLTFDETSVGIHLTQEETLAFDPRRDVEIQIRARFSNGQAVSSNIMTTGVKGLLKDGVI